MNLAINGKRRNFSGSLTVASLVEKLEMKPDRIAVELNGDVIPRHRWHEQVLNDGDRLEIVHFVGGGR